MRFVGEPQWPSAEQLARTHDDLLARWGGDEGGGHRGAELEGVDAALQAAKNSYYETPEELAAALAVYMIQGHVFMDGNKRAGGSAIDGFLHINGLRSPMTNARGQAAMLELQTRAERGERTDVLIAWLASLIRGDEPGPKRNPRPVAAPKASPSTKRPSRRR